MSTAIHLSDVGRESTLPSIASPMAHVHTPVTNAQAKSQDTRTTSPSITAWEAAIIIADQQMNDGVGGRMRILKLAKIKLKSVMIMFLPLDSHNKLIQLLQKEIAQHPNITFQQNDYKYLDNNSLSGIGG